MYVSGALKRFPFSAIAITDIAPGKLLAAKLVPSKGQQLYQNLDHFYYQVIHQYISIGASSNEPSPITTLPFISILFNSDLIESTAA